MTPQIVFSEGNKGWQRCKNYNKHLNLVMSERFLPRTMWRRSTKLAKESGLFYISTNLGILVSVLCKHVWVTGTAKIGLGMLATVKNSSEYKMYIRSILRGLLLLTLFIPIENNGNFGWKLKTEPRILTLFVWAVHELKQLLATSVYNR